MADLLSALSVTMDLAMSLAPEQCIRTCLLATGLAREMALSESEVSDVYYTTLVRHLGCTATTHEEAYLFGPDELAARPLSERTDSASRWETLRLLAQIGKGAGLARPRYFARTLRAGAKAQSNLLRGVCEVGSLLAGRLGLGDVVARSLYQLLERWDGAGEPQGLTGEQISLPARLATVASQAVIFDRLGGPDAAVETLRRRAGGWLDPEAVALFDRVGPKLLRELDAGDVWEAVLAAEPTPYRRADVDAVAGGFADFVDLKSPYLFGHSTGVAELASLAGRQLGLGDAECVTLRRAGLLHDLGRVAVPTGVWEKPGPLGRSDWERVRLHPYHTERILMQSETLAPLARIAGLHHERRDGSGYPRQARGADLPPSGYVLAAADAYQAMTQNRPHRPALTADAAAAETLDLVRVGALDSDAAHAVLSAAGHRPARRRTTWPAGLSEREVEVLRLLARGLSNPEIARSLVVSPRTAEHHVQHIYTKIGVATRAGAAVFAMQHSLLTEA